MSESLDVSPLNAADRWAGAISPPATRAPSMRTFGLVILVGFGVLGTLSVVSGRRGGASWRIVLGEALLAVAVAVFAWSLASPRTLPPVYRAWMTLGQSMGTVVSSLLLSVLYFVVVAPVGLLMRRVGSDPLDRRARGSVPSYWTPHPKAQRGDDYTHLS